jgi:PAS domain S-box-containing protein
MQALQELFPSASFTGEELAELEPFCQVLEVPAGRAIIQEGSPSDNRVYFLLQGAVSVHINGQFILRLSKRGDIVGEMSLITSAPRSATVRTELPCIFLVMHATLEVLENDPRYYKLRYYFSRMFNLILTEKLRRTSDRAKLYEEALHHGQVMEERKAGLEAQLMRNLQQIRLYSHLVDGASDAIVIVDPAGRVQQANASVEALVGMIPVRVEGLPIAEFITWPAALGGGWADITRTANAGGWHGEVQISHAEQGLIPADCTVSLVQDSSGEQIAYSVMLRDIRQRKDYEQRLLAQSQELERAYQSMRELDRLKGNFLTLVSHELRTPITAILAYAETLVRGMVDAADQGDFMNIIHQEALKLSTMVDKVLAITKMESGQMLFQFKFGDLGGVVSEKVAMLRSRATAKNLTLNYTGPAKATPSAFDSERIGEAVEQILDNAIKFTEHGSITATLTQDGKESLLTVHDTGKGIPGDHIATLWGKFERVEDLEHHTHGLGLGLPLCYLIAKAHSGQLRIESEPGQGTTVSLILPHVPAAAA